MCSLACWMVCMSGMVLLYTFLEHHYVDYVITYIMSLCRKGKQYTGNILAIYLKPTLTIVLFHKSVVDHIPFFSSARKKFKKSSALKVS